jgi:hypothetical protein
MSETEESFSMRLNFFACELQEQIELLRAIGQSESAVLKGDAVYAFVTALTHLKKQVWSIHDDIERAEWDARPKPQAA